MLKEKQAIIIFKLAARREIYDVEVPLQITANELFHALNEAYALGADESNLTSCYLQAMNPIALLKGDKTLEEYGLRNASVVMYMG